MKKVSIVLPVYNEDKNLSGILDHLGKVIPDIHCKVQVIFVDDASKDNSFNLLNVKSKHLGCDVVLIRLRTNMGQSSAICAGIKNSDGDYIVTMDSDGQHDPADIVRLIKEIGKGYDMVCGCRENRYKQDSFMFKYLPSRIAGWLINKLTGVKLKDSTGGMRIFSRDILNHIHLYENMNRFLPIIAVWKGFMVGEVPIKIHKREHGKTKYGLFRIYGGFFDLLTLKFLISFSQKPLHFFGGISFLLFLPGLLVLLYLGALNLFYQVSVLRHLFLFFASILSVIIGLVFFSFGIVADMVSLSKIYEFNKPILIKEVIKK